jgi:hypothetical protein
LTVFEIVLSNSLLRILQTMALHTWRRHHGPALVASVIGKARDKHSVVVWDTASGKVQNLQKEFQQLQSAKAAADDLIRRAFCHTCTIDACGEWLFWTA